MYPPARSNFRGPIILLAISAVTGPGLVAWWYLDAATSAGKGGVLIVLLLGPFLVLAWIGGAVCAYSAFKAGRRMRRRPFDTGDIIQALAVLFLACNLLPGAAFLLVLLG
jgi:hypothetical protein